MALDLSNESVVGNKKEKRINKWISANQIEVAGYYWFYNPQDGLKLIALQKRIDADGGEWFVCVAEMGGNPTSWSFNYHESFEFPCEVTKDDLFMLIESPILPRKEK